MVIHAAASGRRIDVRASFVRYCRQFVARSIRGLAPAVLGSSS